MVHLVTLFTIANLFMRRKNTYPTKVICLMDPDFFSKQWNKRLHNMFVSQEMKKSSFLHDVYLIRLGKAGKEIRIHPQNK